MAIVDTCVNYYNFDICSAATAVDLANNKDGTVTGPIKSASYGKIGEGYNFDGTNDYIEISGTGGFFNVSRTTGSVSLWFSPDVTINSGATVNKLLITVGGGTDRYFGLQFRTEAGAATNYLYCVFRNGEGTAPTEFLKSTTATWTAGVWYHVVITWDTSGEEMFINGVSEDTSAYTSGYTSGDSSHASFGYNSTLCFDGDMDEGGFWSTKLASEDVTRLYNEGAGLEYPFTTVGVGLKSYYKFDGGATDRMYALAATVSGATNGLSYGKINEGYLFDGTNDYIDWDGLGGFFNVARTTGSISFWFSPDITVDSGNTVNQMQLSVTGGSGNYFRICFSSQAATATNYLYGLFRNGEGTTPTEFLKSTTATWTAGTWYHVVVTWDTSGEKMYINGTLEDTSAYNSGYSGGDSSNSTFGSISLHSGFYYDGDIDEVGFWNRVLDQDEVTALYNGGSGFAFPLPDLTGWSNTINGVTSFTKINGIAIANISKVNGV